MFKIGYACKYVHPEDVTAGERKQIEAEFNTRATTAKWCKDNPSDYLEKIHGIVLHNIKAVKRQLEYVASLPSSLHMVRIGSDLLPLFTHRDFKHVYRDQTLLRVIERGLSECGEYARNHGIRVSFHPGQFTVLASENPDIVTNSIEEFEYHVFMLKCMGYGKTFQDAKCNVHVGGKLGVNGIKSVLSRLSPEARNVITIENDEMKYGLSELMPLVEHVAIVIDLHHHFINTGEYLSTDDDRVKRVLESWRGVRPTMHYSLSREDVLVGHCVETRPDLAKLLASNYNKQKLRAHSEYMWNAACNRWASGFLTNFDIMIEAKRKNIASIGFYESIKGLL